MRLRRSTVDGCKVIAEFCMSMLEQIDKLAGFLLIKVLQDIMSIVDSFIAEEWKQVLP